MQGSFFLFAPLPGLPGAALPEWFPEFSDLFSLTFLLALVMWQCFPDAFSPFLNVKIAYTGTDSFILHGDDAWSKMVKQ